MTTRLLFCRSIGKQYSIQQLIPVVLILIHYFHKRSACMRKVIIVVKLWSVWLNLSTKPFVCGWYAEEILFCVCQIKRACWACWQTLPWSDMTNFVQPCLHVQKTVMVCWFSVMYTYPHIIWKRNLATHWALFSGRGAASGHFEKKSTKVIMYLLPIAVFGRGPIISTPTYRCKYNTTY